ncbi:MAG: nucleotidyltransferase family protein [Rhodobacter sp.]|nr:nucleotidyltransferase family protein [Rhodobacter sp.]
MLFTAGLGTRMRPLTDHIPKPLIEVGGCTLLDHALHLVRDAGLDRIAGNTHYLADKMGAALAERGVRALHEPVLLDTGGGLRNAATTLGAPPYVTLNSDAVWVGPNPVPTILQAWDPASMDALLVVVPRNRAISHPGEGDFRVDAAGRLRRGTDVVYTGLQIIDPALLDRIEEQVFSLNLAWDLIGARGRLFGHLYDGIWCDVGQPESISAAEHVLAERDV